ncbi:MAG: hypothetical protein HYZ53_20330 [Planctomycetes bacterium]|nr:hypothetical protein [Planctomycetota bacterium]
MSEATRRCPHCKKMNPSGLVHCNKCGGLLPAEAPADGAAPAKPDNAAWNFFLVVFFALFVGTAWLIDRGRPRRDDFGPAAEAPSEQEELLRRDMERIQAAVLRRLQGIPGPTSVIPTAGGDLEGLINAEMQNSSGRPMSQAESDKVREMVKAALAGSRAERWLKEGR